MTDTAAAKPEQIEQQNTADSSPPGRKIVIFADGTGNAFTRQESNIWRLYEAFDRTKPDQVAYYIKGVGTAGWKPFAMLDGATGIGVPSNVRKLYRFLCWNWKPGDQIYIFGFSRGAFTARTLAALIAFEGLVPAVIDDQPVSHAEMQRNAMAAWRSYRSESIGWQSLPTVWFARWIRNIILYLYHLVMRHRSYADVRKAMEEADKHTKGEDKRDNVHVEFLGVFDTVEAFGVPIEELRLAIDWAIWPISFRNGVLNNKIKRARHALSLDDERTTFHPIRFDQSEETEQQRKDGRIKEVWFAGVHSDVGGGYPDGNLSYVPLVWMAGQLEADLRFQPGRIDSFVAYQSALGPAHDSRSGTAVLYRYSPRHISGEDKFGGPPIVHHSVVQRMLDGCDNYAPVTLPANAKVWLPGPAGQIADMTEQPERRLQNFRQPQSAIPVRQQYADAGADAVKRMPVPNQEMSQRTLDTVWWRRVAYFVLLALLVVVAAWPKLALMAIEGVRWLASWIGLKWLFEKLAISNDRLVRVIDNVFELIRLFVPSWLNPWLDTARTYPVITLVLAGVVAWVWLWGGISLRDRVHERARMAWFRPGRKVAAVPAAWRPASGKADRTAAHRTDKHREEPALGKRSLFLSLARAIRTNRLATGAYWAAATFVVPTVVLAVFFGVVAVATGRSAFNWYAGRDTALCQSGGASLVSDAPVKAPRLFETKSMCWGSGLVVEKDRKYRIWIKVIDPWFDRTIMSGTNGFELNSITHIAALPLRRSFGADWFQPIVRFGRWGTDEVALVPLDARPADSLPRTDPLTGAPLPVGVDVPIQHWYEPIPKDALGAAGEVWRRQGLADVLAAEFVAPETGELFLFVNDAIQVLPLLCPWPSLTFCPLASFYDNNSGTAEVEIQRVSPPAAPAQGTTISRN